MQVSINASAEIIPNPVSANTKKYRIDDLVNFISGKKLDNVVMEKLTTGVAEFPLGAASDTMKANADFQCKAGLRSKIIRIADFGCCKWCSDLAGGRQLPCQKR